jgi:transglutaminase-like putative cysteine protease
MTPALRRRTEETRPRRTRPRSARHRRRMNGPMGAASFGPLILSASVAVALSRLIVHGIGTRVLVPLVVSIVVADVATALSLRLRINLILAVGLGWAVSLWAVAIVVDPSLFDPASPHFLHAAELSRQLRAAQSALANDGTPLPSLNGMVGILGALGGLGAALTRAVWALQWRRSVLADRGPLSPCLAPSLAIFVYTCLVSAEQGRVAAFVSYLLGVLAFVALADRATAPSTGARSAAAAIGGGPAGVAGVSGGGVPRPRRFRLGFGALAGCLVVAAVVIATGAGLSGMKLTVFHVNPPTSGTPKNPTVPGPGVAVVRITGLALVDNLLATEISASKVVIFKAHSPVTTYWQVGTLSSFNGKSWLPVRGVSGALSASSRATTASLGTATLPAPAPQHTFKAKVAIADFVSRLLPAPPTTTAVHGLTGATVVGQEGVLAPVATTIGTTYTVRAGYDTSVPAEGTQLASSDPRLKRYLALPTEPSIVSQLAHQAIGSATTPAAEAQALVDWFRSGRFRYTLSPPATKGANPLVQFLTVTKAGYCAQFAGAYGVLARSLGLPTRLVAGFTPGRPGPGNSFTVTGADAHVWPQVYLGPEAGWVSVEPTPGTPAAAGVLGVGGVVPAQPTPTTIVPAAPTTVPHHHVHHHHAARHGRGFPWWIPGAVVGGLLVLALVVLLVRRRVRAYRDARLPPDQRVVRAWDVALSALRRRGIGRRVEETPGEYAVRVQSLERKGAQPVEAAAVADLAALAALVELACYTSRPCTPGQAADAHALASTIVAANRRHRRRRPTPHEAQAPAEADVPG